MVSFRLSEALAHGKRRLIDFSPAVPHHQPIARKNGSAIIMRSAKVVVASTPCA